MGFIKIFVLTNKNEGLCPKVFVLMLENTFKHFLSFAHICCLRISFVASDEEIYTRTLKVATIRQLFQSTSRNLVSLSGPVKQLARNNPICRAVDQEQRY